MAKRSGMVLRWQREVIDGLRTIRPGNQKGIVAVAAAMVTYADPDGSHCYPSIRALAVDTGQSHGGVKAAIDWLIEDGWLRFERRIARGGRDFSLIIPQRSAESNAGDPQRSAESNAGTVRERATLEDQRSGESNAGEPSVQSAFSQRSAESNEPPDLLTSKSSSSDEYVAELVDAVLDRREAAGEIFRNRPALKRKMLREDRDRLLAEDADLRALAARTAALDECSHCDHDGLRWFRPDGTPSTREDPVATVNEKCDHVDVVALPEVAAR